MSEPISPITGIIAEDQVFLDFGEHEGKSVLEICDTEPEFYDFLINQKTSGLCRIKRNSNKIFTLFMEPAH